MRRSRKWERQVAGSRWQVVLVDGGWWLGGVVVVRGGLFTVGAVGVFGVFGGHSH